MPKPEYYSLNQILQYDATYNVIFGERSNGKTYAVLKYAIEQYVTTGHQLALVRRWSEDFIGKRGQTMFDALIANGEISKLTGGEFNSVHYFSSRWYLCKQTEKERIVDDTPFAYGFALTSGEHDKSTSYPKITTIMFDEFLTRTTYLPDEFVLFMNIISTITRQRDDVKIFMLGNTVNQYCPYFAEMGLKHVRDMKQGTIDVYTYGDSRLTVAVEYVKPTKKGKKSDKYFAFDNPKLQMITTGSWEIAIYPHCPMKYRPADVMFTYYIQFDESLLECEVIAVDNSFFTFIHRKTTPLKYPDDDLIYSTEYDPRANYRRKITKPTNNIEKRIAMMFVNDKIFYADNTVGEIVRNYLIWCNRGGGD